MHERSSYPQNRIIPKNSIGDSSTLTNGGHKKIKVVTAEGIHAKIGFDLGCQLAEDRKHNTALWEQIAWSRGIGKTVLSENNKPLSVRVAVSSVADNLCVLSGKDRMRKQDTGNPHIWVYKGVRFSLPPLQLTNRYM